MRERTPASYQHTSIGQDVQPCPCIGMNLRVKILRLLLVRT